MQNMFGDQGNVEKSKQKSTQYANSDRLIRSVLHFQTGAWFFKGIPKYEVPQQRTTASRQSLRDSKLRLDKPVKLGIKCTDTSSEDEDESFTEVDSQKHSPATLNGRSSYDSALSFGKAV